MVLPKYWVIAVFVVCYEQSSIASSVNVLNKNHPDRSRPKKSVDTEIYLALPPNNVKTGKQDNPLTLVRLSPNAPNKYKGKFPTPIERFIQRIQNYFSVYNPPEYLNELRPGINNQENKGDQIDYSNDTQITLPCNGTSTIVIIPVPLENENVPGDQNNRPDEIEFYAVPTTSKPDYTNDATSTDPNIMTPDTKCSDSVTPKPLCHEEVIPVTPKCSETPATKPAPCVEETTTLKPKCPETTTPKPKCPETTTPKPKCPEATTPTPKCPEVTTTPKPKCPEVTTTPKPKCPEGTTTPKSKCPEVTTTPKPKCPEATTPKPKCQEVTTPKPNCPEATTTSKPDCLETTAQKLPYFNKQTSSYPKPISGYGPSEVPPLNLVAQPVLGSTVVYFYKNPSTLPPPNPAAYYIPSTPAPYEVYNHGTKAPILRLKQLLFPRLYAAFHPEH